MKKLKHTSGGIDDEAVSKLVSVLKLYGVSVKEAGERAVEEAVEFLKDESVKRAPIDTGDLERCHETSVQTFKALGKVVGLVYIDDSKMETPHHAPASLYSVVMHEYLLPYGSGPFQLGPKSAEKAASGNDVGGKFLERALMENIPRITQIISDSLTESLRSAK